MPACISGNADTSLSLFVTLAPGYMIIAIFNIQTIMIIWFLAPVGNRVKEIVEIEHMVCQRRSRMILGVGTVIFAAALRKYLELVRDKRFIFLCRLLRMAMWRAANNKGHR